MRPASAHLSSRGVHRIIDGSGHAIQLEKPQVVTDFVAKCSASLRLRRSLKAESRPVRRFTRSKPNQTG